MVETSEVFELWAHLCYYVQAGSAAQLTKPFGGGRCWFVL